MERWKKLVIAGVALAAAAIVIAGLWSESRRDHYAYYLKGTFLCGTRYLTVYEDGSYCDYRQMEMLEEGTFMRREPGIFRFCPDGMPTWELLALDDGTLYRTVDGMIWKYERLFELPTLVNAESVRQPRDTGAVR